MTSDDPRTPLLGVTSLPRQRNAFSKLCGGDAWRRRVPITIWLPKYKLEYLVWDVIAGVTVALTAIPQGIAYAMIAGLPPQVGLYSSIFPGFIYVIFGSCKDITVGPTAILSALMAKYVALSIDFAYLTAFLSGCIILLMGILKLGFLLDYISKPVISGFTTAAGLQISASQLRSLLRIEGKSGGSFMAAMINLYHNIGTAHLWDSVLGVGTIIALLLMKRIPVPASSRSSWSRHVLSCVTRARNAVLVFVTAVLAYGLYAYGITPFALTGPVSGGLPSFGPPPFSTVVGNRTLEFPDMLAALGPESLVIPLVAVLESIAIAKAFAGSKSVQCSQEMVSLGACNAVSACCGAMPATGSFTRTALNHHSGVVTPAGSFFKACVVLLGVTLVPGALYFIPRPTLAAVIMVAMFSILDLSIVTILWRHSKGELLVWAVCVLAGASWSLEGALGLACVADGLRGVARAQRTHVDVYVHTTRVDRGITQLQGDSCEVTVLRLVGSASGAGAVSREGVTSRGVLLDGQHLIHLDLGAAESIVSSIEEHIENHRVCLLWNFKPEHERLLKDLSSKLEDKFFMNQNLTESQVVEYLNTMCTT